MRRCMLLLLVAAGCNQPHAKLEASKRELAQSVVRRHVEEMFPAWALAHPSQACPARLEDLVQDYPHNEVWLQDPWGHAYQLRCGATLPAGAKLVAVMSPGPDGKDGTADDIKSW